MALSWDPKDPDEVLDYDIDWSARLEDGDTLVSSHWLLSDDTLTIDSDTCANAATKIWLSGGSEGVKYTLVNRVVTTGGRTMDQSVRLAIKSK